MTETLKGACLCGGVEYEVQDPEALGYCHCTRCQRWTGSSLAGVVVAKENFKFTKGEDLVKTLRERVRAAQLLQQLRLQHLRRPRREVLRRRGPDARPRSRAELPSPGRLQGQLARDRRRRAAVRRESARLTRRLLGRSRLPRSPCNPQRCESRDHHWRLAGHRRRAGGRLPPGRIRRGRRRPLDAALRRAGLS